jgi:hypothetical protein
MISWAMSLVFMCSIPRINTVAIAAAIHAAIFPITEAELMSRILVRAGRAIRPQPDAPRGVPTHRLPSAVATGERVCSGIIRSHDRFVRGVAGGDAS